MPIAWDTTSARASTTGTSLTFSHTSTGTNLILFVHVLITSASDLVTGVTYAGTSMTRINLQVQSGETTYLYYLTGPATGANNVVISTSASTTIAGAGSTFTGAKQSGQPDASNTGSCAACTPLNTSVTTVADNSWLVISWRDASNGVVTASAGTTKRNDALGDSNGSKTPPGSFSLGQNPGGASTLTNCVASFAPFVAAKGYSPTLLELGVG